MFYDFGQGDRRYSGEAPGRFTEAGQEYRCIDQRQRLDHFIDTIKALQVNLAAEEMAPLGGTLPIASGLGFPLIPSPHVAITAS